MKKIGRILLKIVEEVPAIVVAVFLALIVNDCNENRKEDQLALSSLKALEAELLQNQESLRRNIAANLLEVKEMRADLDSLSTVGLENMSSVRVGISQTILQKSAWDMAILSGSTRQFDASVLTQLAEIYGLQELYDEMSVNYFKELGSVQFYKPDQEKERLQAGLQVHQLTNDISNQLMELYEQVTPQIKAETKK
ncbi:MAG: hypothetical protein KTR30_25860 [Saprospiraceae bacterium]|nr:hypothetical protein [Saprospiraceae bacterium]